MVVLTSSGELFPYHRWCISTSEKKQHSVLSQSFNHLRSLLASRVQHPLQHIDLRLGQLYDLSPDISSIFYCTYWFLSRISAVRHALPKQFHNPPINYLFGTVPLHYNSTNNSEFCRIRQCNTETGECKPYSPITKGVHRKTSCVRRELRINLIEFLENIGSSAKKIQPNEQRVFWLIRHTQFLPHHDNIGEPFKDILGKCERLFLHSSYTLIRASLNMDT